MSRAGLKFSLIFLLFCLSQFVLGQVGDKYNESLWKIIDIVPDKSLIQKSDTMIVIATTRQYDAFGLKKFQDQFDSLSTIKYVLAVKDYGKWKLFFMASLEDAFFYLKPNKDIVFYIEGMGKTFTTNLYRSAGMALQYDVNVVMFDYPTAKPEYSKLGNFYFSKNNSDKVAPLYTLFLKTIQSDQVKNKVWIANHHTTLFHHSMGNRMLKRMVVDNRVDSLKDLKISTLVLNAACVEQKKHKLWITKFSFAKQIIVNYNRKDLHLKAAELITWRRQLGKSSNQSNNGTITYVNLHDYMGKQHNAFLNRPGGYLIPVFLQNYYSTIFHGKKI